jgi:hypothetical protein
MGIPRDFSMQTAQINLAVFRSIYHSAAILALSRKFGDLRTGTIESKTVILEMGTTHVVDSLGRPLYYSDEESMGTGGKIIEAASLWEAALEAGVSEEELTESLCELEVNEANAPNDDVWRSIGDLIEKQAEEADE